MPIRPRNPNNVRSTTLGAATDDHTHAHSEITSVGSDDHHDEDHAARHADGGADEITIVVKQISDILAEIFMHMGA